MIGSIVLLCALLGVVPAAARDFPEPRELADPWSARAGSLAGGATAYPAVALVPAGYGDIAYHDYTFLSGPHDSFSVRSRAGGVPLIAGPFAVGVYWSSILMVGPVSAGDDPASIALWWMNAVQFEYGVIAALRLPAPFRSVGLEYGRTSQHPLRSGYSEIAADVVRASVWLGNMGRLLRPDGRWRVLTGASVSYLDLYDFWESDLLRPRTRYRLTAPVDITIGLTHAATAAVELFLNARPNLLFLRQEDVQPGTNLNPPVQFELDSELGIRFSGHGRIELGLELYTTRDTEQRRSEPAPLTTVGVVVRVGS